MPDPTISNLLGLLSVVANYSKYVCFDTIKKQASTKKHLLVTPQMLVRLCKLGYMVYDSAEERYMVTNDGRTLLTLPLFERHALFLQRKEVHPEGRRCSVCGHSGTGLTKFQKKDYCTDCLNTAYEPSFIYRGCSSLAWEA